MFIIKTNELTIIKKNNFVQDYKIKNLSLTEIRIINYLIANINSPKYDTEFQKFRFDIKEFCKMVYPNSKQGDAYKRLPDVIQKLADKSAWKEVPSTENVGKTKKVLIRWIERPEFEEGFVTLELNPYLAPYLLQIEKGYFQAKFQYTALAQSKYTIPLYELLKSWEKCKTKVFDVDELRFYMDATEKSKNNISEFKRRALDIAVKEINEITDLKISYKEIKQGRKVAQIEFTIKHKKQKIEQFTEEIAVNEPEFDEQIGIDELPEQEPADAPQEITPVSELEAKKCYDESEYTGENAIFSGYLMNEFSNMEMAYLLDAVKERLNIRSTDILGMTADEETAVINYLQHYYKSLELTQVKTSRFNVLRNKLEQDYDKRAEKSFPRY